MILIEGTPLHFQEPRMHFANTNCEHDDRHSYLDRAIIRSKVHRDGHNYLIGEKIILKNEYMEYANNLLIIHMHKDETKFFIILKGHVFAATEDPEDTNIKNFFKTHEFSIVDSYGKELYIHDHDEFMEFIAAVKDAHKKFNSKLDFYHKHMETLFKMRRERAKMPCCFCSEYFDKLIELADELGKELCDALATLHNSDSYNVAESYVHKLSEKEKKCIIFGLYLAILCAYKLSYDGDPLSLDERIRVGVYKEFDYFLSENEGILDDYAQYFKLRKIEIDNIKQLLNEEGLTHISDWCTPAEINIL